MNDFERDARSALRGEEQHLGVQAVQRIGAARQAALATRPLTRMQAALATRPLTRMQRILAPTIGAAVLASPLRMAVLLPQHPQGEAGRSSEQAELVDNPELYRDLDFYLWLAESEMGRHG